jgi:hypothetical protein
MDSGLEFDMDEYSIIIPECSFNETTKESIMDEEKLFVRNIHFKGRFRPLK